MQQNRNRVAAAHRVPLRGDELREYGRFARYDRAHRVRVQPRNLEIDAVRLLLLLLLLLCRLLRFRGRRAAGTGGGRYDGRLGH